MSNPELSIKVERNELVVNVIAEYFNQDSSGVALARQLIDQIEAIVGGEHVLNLGSAQGGLVKTISYIDLRHLSNELDKVDSCIEQIQETVEAILGRRNNDPLEHLQLDTVVALEKDIEVSFQYDRVIRVVRFVKKVKNNNYVPLLTVRQLSKLVGPGRMEFRQAFITVASQSAMSVQEAQAFNYALTLGTELAQNNMTAHTLVALAAIQQEKENLLRDRQETQTQNG